MPATATETVEKAEELLREDAERLRREHPDLVDQLQEYEDDWRKFLEVLGRTESSERTAASGAQRRAYRT